MPLNWGVSKSLTTSLEYEVTIPLDANSLDWDLIYIPIGVDKAQSYFEFQAYIEDI